MLLVWFMIESRNAILEQVQNSGYLSSNGVNFSLVQKSSAEDILYFVNETIEHTRAENIEPEPSMFAHSASISMGGGRYPCSRLECRMARIDELIQFAALYSEKVYISNIFCDYLGHGRVASYFDEQYWRYCFEDDLKIIFKLLPLIEAGIVVPITVPRYCAHCLLGAKFGSDADDRLDAARAQLANWFRSGIDVEISKRNGNYSMKVEGAERLLEHGSVVLLLKELPSLFESHPRLKARVERGDVVKFSSSLLRKSHVGDLLADEVFGSLLFELTSSQCLNTSFLTNREVEADFLHALGYPETRAVDQFVGRHLSAMMPFLGNVSPEEILKVRENDGDGFVVFRNSLRKVVSEYCQINDAGLIEKGGKEIFGDIIEPELAKISKKLAAAQRLLARNAASTVVGWSAALSIGSFAGWQTGGLVEAAAALGFTKILASLVGQMASDSDTRASIKGEDFYFLWQVKRLSER